MKGLCFMTINNKNLHLTAEERKIIEDGIRNGATKKSIADTLGKDKSTIGKEIKTHRYLSHKCSLTPPCARMTSCRHNHVCGGCDDFVIFRCSRRDRSPGACNGCSKYTHCRYDKYTYSADLAHKEYRAELVNSRAGVNLSPERLKMIADIVVPLIKKGQSPYQIINDHPELGISKKTLYNYIEEGLFRDYGLLNIDLRIKVKRKPTKKKDAQLKERKDRKYLKGRTYKDFQDYIEENPYMSIVEMDTVYNDGSNGPFMQTFKFLSYSFMFIIYHEEKTSTEMVRGVDLLESILGKDLFAREVAIIKTDRGSEFIDATGIEKEEDGSRRTRVFYCDPMMSGQKGSLENNHKEIRYICPKKADLRKLGLDCQEKANIMTSHINSQSKEKLKGRSPLEMMAFLSPELYERFREFGIREIDRDDIVLKPYIIKNR